MTEPQMEQPSQVGKRHCLACRLSWYCVERISMWRVIELQRTLSISLLETLCYFPGTRLQSPRRVELIIRCNLHLEGEIATQIEWLFSGPAAAVKLESLAFFLTFSEQSWAKVVAATACGMAAPDPWGPLHSYVDTELFDIVGVGWPAKEAKYAMRTGGSNVENKHFPSPADAKVGPPGRSPHTKLVAKKEEYVGDHLNKKGGQLWKSRASRRWVGRWSGRSGTSGRGRQCLTMHFDVSITTRGLNGFLWRI